MNTNAQNSTQSTEAEETNDSLTILSVVLTLLLCVFIIGLLIIFAPLLIIGAFINWVAKDMDKVQYIYVDNYRYY